MTQNPDDPALPADLMPHQAYASLIGHQSQGSQSCPLGRSSIQDWMAAPITDEFMALDDAMKRQAFAVGCLAHSHAMALATHMLTEHANVDPQLYVDYLCGTQSVPKQYTCDDDATATQSED